LAIGQISLRHSVPHLGDPTIKEYLIKGFVLTMRRLNKSRWLGYFDELLERIREIRASEKRFLSKNT